MINPENIVPVEYQGEHTSILVLNDIPEYDLIDYDLYDEKDFKKFITDVERVVRNSYEYRGMVNYLRENFDMNKCTFYENVNNLDSFKIKIHLHHHPFTLYDIALIVYNKRASFNESLEIELVAKEVMYLHYKLMIGLIPLSETVHELVHNMYLFVPVDKVFGHYQEFLDQYYDFLIPEQIDTIDRIKAYSETYNEEVSKSVLNKNYIYLDVTGVYHMPKYEEILQMMENKIEQIKNNNSMINPIVIDKP